MKNGYRRLLIEVFSNPRAANKLMLEGANLLPPPLHNQCISSDSVCAAFRLQRLLAWCRGRGLVAGAASLLLLKASFIIAPHQLSILQSSAPLWCHTHLHAFYCFSGGCIVLPLLLMRTSMFYMNTYAYELC
jgi:hypothetical protein